MRLQAICALALVLCAAPLLHAQPDASSVSAWQPLLEPSVGGRITGISVSPHDSSRVLVGGDVLGVGLSTDGGDTWGSTFGFLNWQTSQFTWHPTDPNTVWAATLGGPYVSRDAGRNWAPSRTGLPATNPFGYSAPIETILFDPNNSDILVAVGGSSRRQDNISSDALLGAVWVSANGGDSWSYRTTIQGNGSTNAQPNTPGENIVGAAFLAGQSNTILLGVEGRGVLRSFDLAGGTFAASNAGLPHNNVERVVADPSNSNRAYVSLTPFDNGTTLLPGGVYVTEDAGLSWSPVNNGLDQNVGNTLQQTSGYRAFAGDATDASFLVAGDDRFGSNGIYTSQNGGDTWQLALDRTTLPLPYPSDIEMEVATVAPSDPDVIFLGGSANFIRSQDGGETWDDAGSINLGNGAFRGRGYSGLIATQATFNPWDPDHILLQGFDAARVIQTKDGGESWTFETGGDRDFQGGRDASFASVNVAYASLGFQNAYEGVGRTTDGGETWEVLGGAAVGLPEIGASNTDAGGIIASTTTAGHVWTIADNDVYRTTNGGDNWSIVAPNIGDGWFAFSPDESILYVSGEDAVYSSTDGETFTSIGGPGESGRLAVSSDGTLYLASHSATGRPGNGLWAFTETDGWNPILDPDTLTGPLLDVAEYIRGVDVHPLDPDILVITTDDPPFRDISLASGVLITFDGGENWSFINDNLPLLRGAVVTFNPHNPNELLFGSTGRGFYTATIPEPNPLTLITVFGILMLIARRRNRDSATAH
ncbi:MAG: hypothetical protein AAF797_00775 [Planctomycetota bacterium]